jgi:multidrug efflux pump subunit AcrA (membrane-fusion protein)
MTRFLLTMSLALCVALPPGALSADDAISFPVLLKIVEEVDVPAEQAGVLRELLITEGAVVAAGDLLGQLDDEAARLTEQRAAVDAQVAERLAADHLPIDVARKTLEQAQQKLGELELQEQMATRQAANELAIQASAKARDLAEVELQRAIKSRELYEPSVSQSEIDGRRLESEKADLEARQSVFEQQIDSLKADVARVALDGQMLAVSAAELEVDQATEKFEVRQLEAQLKRHDLELARLNVQRRRVLSPLDGIVVEIYQRRGEWVEPGQSILRIQRQNRLWVEGLVPVEQLADCRVGCPVRVAVPLSEDETSTVEGQIVLIGREVDPVNREVLIRAEIPNEDLRLLPGMDGELTLVIPGETAATTNDATR